MGLKLMTTTLGSLILIFAMDFFIQWYRKFLDRFSLDAKTKLLINRIFWVVMALLFWRSLLYYGFPEQFGMPFLLFVLFIYSVRGLIIALFKKSPIE